MVARLKESKRYGLILMKGGKGLPDHWERHLENLGYRVHKINDSTRPLSEGELINRWYPGIRRSLQDMVGDVKEIEKLTGIPKERINEVIQLKDKSSFTVEDEKRLKEFVDSLLPHKDELKDKGIKSAHTLVTSVAYLDRPVQWVMLERTADRSKILEKLGLDENTTRELLKGKNYNDVTEQDFIKAVIVGATNMEKAHEGSLRDLAMKDIRENGLMDIVGLEEKDFYPFIQNVVHCPWAEELDVDLNLLTDEEKKRIISVMKG